MAADPNGHTVELLHDGGPKGTRVMAECPNRIASFFLPYGEGTLEAVSRDEDGNELARHTLTTAGPPAALKVDVDKQALRADDQDLAHVQITVVDGNGVRVPDAAVPVGIDVEGPARLAGMDNGDLCCHEPYQAPRRHTHRGRCLAVVRAGHTPGPVKLTAITPDLPAAVCEFTVQ